MRGVTQFRIVLPLFAGLAVACAAAARAQPAASPDSGSDDATVVEAPASPAAAPPAPASLPATPLPARPSAAGVPRLAIALPPGMEPLPLGGFRLRFVAGSEAPPAAAQSSLAVLGQALAAIPAGRIVLTGQASGPAADAVDVQPPGTPPAAEPRQPADPRSPGR